MGDDTTGGAGGFDSAAGASAGAGAGGNSYGNYYDEYGALLHPSDFWFSSSCLNVSSPHFDPEHIF